MMVVIMVMHLQLPTEWRFAGIATGGLEPIPAFDHIGPQTILVTNLVTNSVTNLSPNLVITKQSDKFVTKFVTDIGVHQIW